eukprot:scaffold2912_cov68-Phaeocystis_antarctica.AAC.1
MVWRMETALNVPCSGARAAELKRFTRAHASCGSRVARSADTSGAWLRFRPSSKRGGAAGRDLPAAVTFPFHPRTPAARRGYSESVVVPGLAWRASEPLSPQPPSLPECLELRQV